MDQLLVSPDRLAQLEELLLLFHRILTEPTPPPRRRDWLLEHCRRRSADERDLWRALAGYRSSDATALLHADHTRGSIFSRQAALVRENILSQLIDAPQCVLGGFDELSQLLQLIGDRLQFLCDWVLELFLTPEPWQQIDSHHLEVAGEVLLQKLAEEVERLRELYAEQPRLSLDELTSEYRDWLCRRAVVGEREDLE